jgi:hypothetical protein
MAPRKSNVSTVSNDDTATTTTTTKAAAKEAKEAREDSLSVEVRAYSAHCDTIPD